MTNKDIPGKKAKVIGETAKSTAAQEEQVAEAPSAPDTAAEEKVEAPPMATRAPLPKARNPRPFLFILFALILVGVVIAVWLTVSQGTKVPAKPGAQDSGGGGAPANCQSWDKISVDDAGKQLCAYGVVKTAYTGKGITNIRFSDGKDTFRFVNSQGKDFSKTVGQCISAEGTVKLYGKMPYIEIGDKVEPCK